MKHYDALHQTYQQYLFPIPSLDTNTNPAMLQGGPIPLMPRLVGVDGRESGKLKRFPGFYTDTNWDIPSTDVVYRWYKDPEDGSIQTLTRTSGSGGNNFELNGEKGTTFFQYFAIQKDVKNGNILRGWLTLCNYTDDDDNVIDALLAVYYDTEDTTWYKEVIHEFTVPYGGAIGVRREDVNTASVGVKSYFIDMEEAAGDEWTGRSIFSEVGSTVEEVSITGTSGVDNNLITFGVSPSWNSSPADNEPAVISEAKTLRYVDEIDVTTSGRHILVTAQLSKTDDSSATGVNVMIRCDADFDTTAHTAQAGSDLCTFANKLGAKLPVADTAQKQGLNWWRGAIASWSSAGDKTAKVIQSLSDADSPVASDVLNVRDPGTIWFEPSNDNDPAGKIISLQKQKWQSAPLSPGSQGRPYDADDMTDASLHYNNAVEKNLPAIVDAGFEASHHWSHAGDNEAIPHSGVIMGCWTNKYKNADKSLEYGQITLAVRFVAPEQNWYSNLTKLTTRPYESVTGDTTHTTGLTIGGDEANWLSGLTYDGDTSGLYVNPIHWPSEWNSFATRRIIQIFRSTSDSLVPQTQVPTGLLYLAAEIDMDETRGIQENIVTLSDLSDEGLILLDSLDSEEVQVLPTLPPGKLISEYENLIFHVSIPDQTDDGIDLDALRWSTTRFARPNYIPVLNRRLPPDLSSSIKEIVNAGSFLAVVGDNQILRVHRSGTRLAIDTIHNRHGVASKQGVISVGSNLFIVSKVGLLVCDLHTGTVTSIPTVHRIFSEDWRSTIENVDTAYDSGLGALFFINTSRKEAVVLWMNEEVATELHYLPFTNITSGPDPENGGPVRAWFYEPTSGTIFRVDDDEASGSYTLSGGAGSALYNVTADGTHTTTKLQFQDADGETHNTEYQQLVGMPVVCTGPTTSDNYLAVRYVSVVDTTGEPDMELTFSSVWPAAPTDDETYSLAPIVFKVILPPLSAHPDQPTLDMFQVKKLTAMAAKLQDYTDEDGTPNDNLWFRVYKENLSTVLVSTLKEMQTDLDTNTVGSYARTLINGTTLLPAIEQYASNCPFSLTSVLAWRTLEGSRKTS